jgi:phosphoglycerate dehydrogenase-like enzyme
MRGAPTGKVRGDDPTSVCLLPSDEWVLVKTVSDAGGRITPAEKAEVLVSFNGDIELIRRVLHPGIQWVQLGSAGIDKWVDAGVVDRDRIWTASRGVYALPIAEHVLTLMLAAARDLPQSIRTQRWGPTDWGGAGGCGLAGRTVGIIGCGGIGEALIELLKPFRATIIAERSCS